MTLGDMQEVMTRIRALEMRVKQLEQRPSGGMRDAQQPVTGFAGQPRYYSGETTHSYDDGADETY